MQKKALGEFSAFIDPDHIKTEGEGDSISHLLHFYLFDELDIKPALWDVEQVQINFDGGAILLTRKRYLRLIKEYEKLYYQKTHQEAIDRLLSACQDIKSATKRKASIDALKNIRRILFEEKKKV